MKSSWSTWGAVGLLVVIAPVAFCLGLLALALDTALNLVRGDRDESAVKPEPRTPNPEPSLPANWLVGELKGERYMIRYRAGQEAARDEVLRRWAANPELNLTPEGAELMIATENYRQSIGGACDCPACRAAREAGVGKVISD